jgi:hypothetical protein
LGIITLSDMEKPLDHNTAFYKSISESIATANAGPSVSVGSVSSKRDDSDSLFDAGNMLVLDDASPSQDESTSIQKQLLMETESLVASLRSFASTAASTATAVSMKSVKETKMKRAQSLVNHQDFGSIAKKAICR